MGRFFILPALVMLSSGGVSGQTPPDEIRILFQQLDAASPAEYRATLGKMSPEQREKWISHLVEALPKFVADPDVDISDKEAYSKYASALIKNLGNDEQKVRAFGDLHIYGSGIADASAALASCEGTRGVEILEAHARRYIPLVKRRIDHPEVEDPNVSKRGRLTPDVSLYFLLTALSESKNPVGGARLLAIREDMEQDFRSEIGRKFLLAIDGLIKNSSQSRVGDKPIAAPSDLSSGPQGGTVESRPPVREPAADREVGKAGERKWILPSVLSGLSLLVMGLLLKLRKRCNKN